MRRLVADQFANPDQISFKKSVLYLTLFALSQQMVERERLEHGFCKLRTRAGRIELTSTTAVCQHLPSTSISRPLSFFDKLSSTFTPLKCGCE